MGTLKVIVGVACVAMVVNGLTPALWDAGARADTSWTEMQGPPASWTGQACSDQTGTIACAGAQGTCAKVAGTCPGDIACQFKETAELISWGKCITTTGATCLESPTVGCATIRFLSGNPLMQECDTATFRCTKTLFFINGCNVGETEG
jgi:hypothetical protein